MKNVLGQAWVPVWIPYHDGLDGVNPISFQTNSIRNKDSTKGSLGLTWNNRRELLDQETFNKWDLDGTPQSKP